MCKCNHSGHTGQKGAKEPYISGATISKHHIASACNIKDAMLCFLLNSTDDARRRKILALCIVMVYRCLVLITTRHLVLDFELQCGPGSRRARSTVPSTYAAQKKLSKQNATSLRQESRFTYSSSPISTLIKLRSKLTLAFAMLTLSGM